MSSLQTCEASERIIRSGPAASGKGALEAWTVVIPFKGGPAAKSRLGHSAATAARIQPDLRHRLALAFLCDTVAAAATVPEITSVIIVSSDPALITALTDITVLADPGHGLNSAAAAGITWARAQAPHGPVAVMAGDLPCITAGDLAHALGLARRHPLSLVPDRHGTGSTLISALPGVPVSPRFGPRSCQDHLRAGHVILPIPSASTLRQDVDTVDDLDRALRLGVGRHTRSALPYPRSPGGKGFPDSSGRFIPSAAAVDRAARQS